MAECVELAPIYGPVIENPAWDTGLSTGEFASGDFYYGFIVSPNVQGVVAGVNDEDTTPHFNDIDYGFIFSDGTVQIMENGVYVGPAATTYNPDDLFLVMRLGTTVYYLRGFEYDYDTAVYYDDQLPGVPLPGNIMYASQVESLYPTQFDTSIFGINDTVCIIAEGVNWQEERGLNTASLYGDFTFIIAGAGGYGPNAGQLEGDLTFSGSATGTAVEGVPAGIIDFKLDFGDIVRDRLEGELRFTGGLDGGAAGVTTPYYSELYTSSNLNGYMKFEGFASGETFYPSGVHAGEFPILLRGASDEFINIVYDAGIDGELTFNVAGVGTPTGSGIKNGAALLLDFDIQGAGTSGTSEATSALFSELTFDIQGTGGSYPDNKLTTAVLDGQLTFAFSGWANPVHTNYFQILLPEIGGIWYETFGVEITEDILATTQAQARLVLLVRDFISIVTTPRTFRTHTASITEVALAVATAIPDFSLYIAEQFNIDSTISVLTAIELADEVLAAGLVQNTYQAVVAVLSALYVSDNKITGGSAEGSTAGVGVQDFGPPSVEFTFTGYWQAGTVIELGYTTDVGPGFISYTTQYPGDAGDTMTLFTAALDAQALVNATFDGTSVTITAQAPATTVQL